MRLLVTGTEGFIGKNVYQKLVKIDDVTKVTCLEKDYMNQLIIECSITSFVT